MLTFCQEVALEEEAAVVAAEEVVVVKSIILLRSPSANDCQEQ